MKFSNTLKKLCVGLLSLTLLVTAIPMGTVTAAATVVSGTCGTNLNWVLEDSGELTISGSGAMTDYYSIDAPWYSYKSQIKTVVVEDGVTSIGARAFYSCYALTDASISDSVKTIGYYAFGGGCSNLTQITIPYGVTAIGNGAFVSCYALTNVNIPDSVITIGQWAFEYCTDLKTVTVGKSVATIDRLAFHGCTALSQITLPVSVTNIKQYAFLECNSLANVYYDGTYEQWSKINIESDNLSLYNAILHTTDYVSSNVAGIGIKTMPQKMVYCVGEEFNTNGLSLNVTYIDGTTAVITEGYTVSGFSSATAGKNQITITYQGRKATFFVEIKNLISSGSCGENVTWTLDEDYTLRISGNGAMEDYSRTSAPWGSAIRSVVIENGVTSIGDGAFKNCYDLQSANIAGTVKTIGDYAFAVCTSLYSVVIAEGVEHIGDSAFEMNESLFGIGIPSSVTSMSGFPFHLCWSLDQIGVSADNPVYSSDSKGALYNKDKTLLIWTSTRAEEFVVPNTVTEISGLAFAHSINLLSITIPKSVKKIHSGFLYCDELSDIYYLGSQADFEEIYIDQQDTYLTNATWHYNSCIGTDSHEYQWVVDSEPNCGNEGIKHEECSVCQGKNSENTIIPATGNHTYDYVCDSVCNVCEQSREVYNHIYDNACDADCNRCGAVREAHIYVENVCTVCGRVNYDAIFTYREIEGEIEITGYKGEPEELVIPEEIDGKPVVRIGGYAFYNCESLKSVTIPKNIKSMGNSAFYNCNNLNKVNITDLAAWCNVEFEYSFANPLYCARNLYLNNVLVTDLVIPEGVTSIGNYAFTECRNIQSVTIPNGVTCIGDWAFYNLGDLESITVPEGVTSIGDFAFSNCHKLKSVILPDSVESIGGSAFGHCQSLESIRIPKGVTSIGVSIFYNCKNLIYITVDSSNSNFSSVDGILFNKNKTKLLKYPTAKSDISYTIPDSVITIEDDAFSYCENLENITIPFGVTSIGKDAFYLCYNLTSVVIPYSVTSIGDNAFCGCNGLISITIPASVINIDNSAFFLCSNLETVNYTGTEEEWNGIFIGTNNTKLTNADIVYNYICPHDFDITVFEPACDQAGGNELYCIICGHTEFVQTAPAKTHEFVEFESGCKFCKNCDYGEISHPDFVDGVYVNGYGWADLDNDGKIGLDDLTLVNEVVMNIQFDDATLACKAADVNGDGKIDMKDVVRTKKILGIIPGGGAGEYTTLTDIPSLIQE